MKKFLAVVSLMLVALMVIAIPAVSAEERTFKKPEGINIHYATDVSENTPNIDGTISASEYGSATRIDTPIPMQNGDPHWGYEWAPEDYGVDETLASEYIDVYFAYDDEYFYFAFEELGAPPANTEDDDNNTWNNVPFRSNYRFSFGFDLDNAGNYIHPDGGDTRAWDSPTYFLDGQKTNQSIVTFSQMATEVIVAKYDALSGDVVSYGDILFASGNTNYIGGQSRLVAEFKLEKAGIVETWNALYGTEYNTVSNAMWIGLTTNAFRCITPDWDHEFQGQYFNWLGQNNITDRADDYAEYGINSDATTMLDLVVFGTEQDEIIIADPHPPRIETEATTEPATEAPETEAATTEAPATEAPATEEATTKAPATEEATTEAPKTEAPTTEAPAKEEDGCGSTIGVAGLALVAALGTCTVFVSKKRD